MPDQSSQKLKELLRRIEQLPTELNAEPNSQNAPLPRATITIVPGPLTSEELPLPAATAKQQTTKRSYLGVIMIGGVAAACGVVGLLLVNQPATESADTNLHRTASVATEEKAPAPISGAPPPAQEPASPTQIAQATPPNSGQAAAPTKTPSVIPTKLSVQSVTIGSGQRTAMAIRSEPPLPADSPFQVRVRRLPPGLSFNVGSRLDAEAWNLSVLQIANLELVSSDVPPGRFSLLFELISTDGRVLAVSDGQVTVTGPLLPLADTERLNEEDQEKLLGQGLVMLASGNVNSARLLLQRAADAGNARAALILGDTYDAERLARIGGASVVPDRDKAAFWYSRADELGASEAKERLSLMNAR